MQANLYTLNDLRNYRIKRISKGKQDDVYLLMDTCILFLLLIGICDKSYIQKCPYFAENGKNYDENHYELLNNILDIFLRKVAITPHVISEVSMLRKRITTAKMKEYFTNIVGYLSKLKENHVGVNVLSKNGKIVNFGYTDISLIESANQNQWPILTDDSPMKRSFEKSVPIISFSAIVANEAVGK